MCPSGVWRKRQLISLGRGQAAPARSSYIVPRSTPRERLSMSLMGLGCVKTLAGRADVKPSGRAERASDYALIAALRGWMPMMFLARVRL
jgi:hypothetical protein